LGARVVRGKKSWGSWGSATAGGRCDS
jgi:hypothetical protein